MESQLETAQLLRTWQKSEGLTQAAFFIFHALKFSLTLFLNFSKEALLFSLSAVRFSLKDSLYLCRFGVGTLGEIKAMGYQKLPHSYVCSYNSLTEFQQSRQHWSLWHCCFVDICGYLDKGLSLLNFHAKGAQYPQALLQTHFTV